MSSSSCLCEMTQTQEPVTPTRNLKESKEKNRWEATISGGQMQRSRTTRYARAPARARCLSHTWNLLPSASHWPRSSQAPGSFPPHEDKQSGRHLISQCPVCDLFVPSPLCFHPPSHCFRDPYLVTLPRIAPRGRFPALIDIHIHGGRNQRKGCGVECETLVAVSIIERVKFGAGEAWS